MSPPVFHYEIENKPLRAEHGRLTFTGWCVCAGESRSPAVRLVAGEQVFPLKSRRRREDVGPAHPGSPIDCGFEIEARLRPGATIVRLEASANNQEWHPLKQLTVVTTPDRLRAVIENPAQDAKVTASMRVQGWCAHADYELAEVWLHYGDQKVRCEYGLKRTDVPSLVPGAVNAPRAGFIASKNIPAGYSRLRLMGVMKTGERCIAETRTFIDVDTDEDHPDSIDLRGVRPELGAARRQLAPARPPAARAGAPLRVLFVLYGDFTSNSAIHVANLANHLANAGHTCTVAVPRNPETAASFRHARFAAIDYAEALVRSAGSPFDLVHAWTTRENVRQFCGRLKAGQPGTRLLVHLEDNEMKILELSLGRSMIELVALSAAELDELVPATLSHPRHSRKAARRSR